MADLFTHASVAVLARLTQSRPAWVATFVAGTCLPDIARVPTMVLTRARWSFPAIPEPLCYIWAPMHLPVGIVLVSYLVSLLFRQSDRPTAFKNLLGGGLLHLLVDMFQTHFGLGYLLLFPLSDWDFEFGLIGSEDTVLLVPFLAPATALLAARRWRR